MAEHARAKLESKQADLIVANDVTAEGAGFDHDTNVITLYSARRKRESVSANAEDRRGSPHSRPVCVELRRATAGKFPRRSVPR